MLSVCTAAVLQFFMGIEVAVGTKGRSSVRARNGVCPSPSTLVEIMIFSQQAVSFGGCDAGTAKTSSHRQQQPKELATQTYPAKCSSQACHVNGQHIIIVHFFPKSK